AKKNNLNIGDKLTIATPGNTSGVEVSLTGIYEFADKTDETELSPSELSENIIYVGHDTGLLLDDGKKGIISVKFFIGQPDQLAAVFSQVQKLDIDWNKYELFNEADTSVIDAESVKDVSNQFSVLTAVIIVAGLLVISLVLMLQTKMRVNEIAILLSLGFTKNTILLQHMFEAMIPAGISIVISYFIGRYLISSELFRAINLSVNKIQMVTIVQIIVINISLLIASIWVASIRILSEPPKAISEKNN
ncbi:ABC transporter permease, partial [uncultured Robinsoniella sp.]|uniref:ABC transporter permease n=1 Tax=uncultured Robinsoniella sp. TaxID=904190 RepID=UPI00374EF1BB